MRRLAAALRLQHDLEFPGTDWQRDVGDSGEASLASQKWEQAPALQEGREQFGAQLASGFFSRDSIVQTRFLDAAAQQ